MNGRHPLEDLLNASASNILDPAGFPFARFDPGIIDDVVIEKARTQEALLVTADKDFGEPHDTNVGRP